MLPLRTLFSFFLRDSPGVGSESTDMFVHLRSGSNMLQRLLCQEDLSFKIFRPPSAGTIGGPWEEEGPSRIPSPLPRWKSFSYGLLPLFYGGPRFSFPSTSSKVIALPSAQAKLSCVLHSTVFFSQQSLYLRAAKGGGSLPLHNLESAFGSSSRRVQAA